MSAHTPTPEQIDAVRKRIRQHFEGEEGQHAVKSLRAYRRSFTGARFEALVDPDVNTITANDLVAVGTLGVTVPATAAIPLLLDGMRNKVSALLRDIPNVPIWDSRADLERHSPAWQLWFLLKELPGMGPVITSKLLAAKRPALIPIEDQHVCRSLDLGTTYWELLQAVYADAELRDSVDDAARDARMAHLSTLRTVDIVVWMREYGYTRLTKPAELVGYQSPLPR